MSKALVLGGGGPVGIAWETGVLAGLAEAGVNLADADYILGTSAGSYVGAHLAIHRDPAVLLANELALAETVRNAAPSGEPRPAPDLSKLMAVMMGRDPGKPLDVERRIELGRMALDAQTVSQESFIAGFGPLAEEQPWPAGYHCTAVDAVTGELVIWGDDKAAPLGHAIASSCSVPTIFPPIVIDGQTYIDGGMRSGTNADLATGHAKVLVLAVMPPAFALFMKPGVDAELAALQAGGSQTDLIIPDTEAGEAFGPNLMDGNRRAEVAHAGRAQGLRLAERIGMFWN